jgi:uncharacterized protein YgiM (DUF1202 family)
MEVITLHNDQTNKKNRVFFTTIGIVFTAVSLVGCESLPTSLDGIIGASIVPAADPNDPCNQEVQSFQEDVVQYQPLITDSEIQMVFKGMISQVTGIGQSAVSMEDIAMSVAQASLSRMTTAYLTKLTDETANNREAVVQGINADARADSEKLQRTQRKISTLRSCREQQIARIDQNLKARRITPQTADQQYQDVQRLVSRDNKFLNRIMELSGERVNTYAEAEYYITTGQEVSKGVKFAQKGSNVRSGPSTSTSVLGKVSRGEQIKTVSRVADGEWYAIDYQGRQGYIYASLLDDRPPRKGSGVKKVVASQEKAEREQEELVKLDRTIERRRTGLEA